MRNILFIHTDSMDGRIMGCMGHPAMRRTTPNIDALARAGVMFSTAYANNAICVPSRASMWSGQFTHHCKGWNNYKGLEPGTPTFRTHLEAAGYQVPIFGKTDYKSGGHSIRARVSAWTRSAMIHRPHYRMEAPQIIEEDTARIHLNDWQAVDRAVDFLRGQHPDGPPFMAYIGLLAPHPPLRTSRRYLDRIDADQITLPPDDPTDHPALHYQRVIKNWEHGFDPDMVRRIRHVYFAMIAEVDEMVGYVLRGLEESGLADSTHVIFSSDHGELAAEHRQLYKMSMYEASVRVPLIFAGPGTAAGTRVDRPVSLVDLYPTLMDMAGLPHPPGLDGQSLLSEVRGQRPEGLRDWAFAECHDTTSCTGSFMLRRGDWKYIVFAGMSPLLFDLAEDPHEVRNLALTRPDIVADLDQRLRQVVDYEAVDAEVKAYDRASFRRWREEQLAAGTYHQNMAHLHSGWDHLDPSDIQPWREEDERRIVQWLEGKGRAE